LVHRACSEVEGFAAIHDRFRRNISVLGRSPKTYENYVRHVAAIALHFNCVPTELDAEDIQDYLYQLQQQSKTPSQTYFKHTVYGLRFLLKAEGLPYAYLRLPAIQKDKKLPVVLSKAEVFGMLGVCDLLKHKLLIGLLYGCGLRCMEVRNLKLQDLDFDRRQLHIKQGKNKKDRIVPLSNHLIRGIRAFIQAEQPSIYLFNGQSNESDGKPFDSRYSQRGVQWAVSAAAKKAGILKVVSVHTLRHTYATHLLEDGLDILSVQSLLGHSRIDTTLEYLHVAQMNPKRLFSPIDTLFATCGNQNKK
jgi:integrase/recombinase XerD